ncbi:hypothetical protein CSV75_05600 [Sporosarcina sp. P18a]|uniref:hypothetical protein n=1 Tax=unclassified Sporosarcina TaxID=2647733 RepID=UPI000C1688BE|nr:MULTISPECIES: hypothetical protein [unclassified Sporosarcina]PIC71946.1 hypothetical protein CSV77_01690 [Sporosarcina sp. P16b]PIC81252.1 hypothetical protein CSV75_05600 [Sporosarcina sp. P18a]PID02071.1 hypothetical protein CSV67_10500 [Sporosarcina sp. P2]PID25714.1 hypothetical protein CSV60_03725 [Sporosarcina sp. P7]
MLNDQYKVDFEQQRKEIKEKVTVDKLPSRAEVHGKKKEEKYGRVKVINIFLAIFTLIPIIILLYVLSDLYSPDVPDQVPVEKVELSVGFYPSATHFIHAVS